MYRFLSLIQKQPLVLGSASALGGGISAAGGIYLGSRAIRDINKGAFAAYVVLASMPQQFLRPHKERDLKSRSSH